MVLWGHYWGLVKRASGIKRDEGEFIYSSFPPLSDFFHLFPLYPPSFSFVS